MDTKICYTCQKEKDVEDFFRSRISKDGRKSSCKECKKGLEEGTIKSRYDRRAGGKVRENFSGRRFGKLIAGRRIRDVNIERKRPSVIQYECLCDCGNTTIVTRSNLQSGGVKSCGCLYKETAEARGAKHREIPAEYHRVLSYYKRNATRRKISWNLSPKDFENIILKNCFYCGCPPRNRMFGGREVCGNGIDRVNNDKDYDLSNVVPCCSSCNIAKYCRTVEDFVLWAEKVAKRKEEILCQICS